MRNLIVAAALGICLLIPQTTGAQPPKSEKGGHTSAAAVAAATYEHLANVIIEIKAAEDQLVKSILIGYHQSAQNHLRAAMRGDQSRRAANLEAAAADVSNIANEGDKRIQAIRQRLSKAGHTHNTDAETKGDYMFVTNKEKKGLVDLAGRIAKAGADAKPAEIEALAKELASGFEKAIAPE